MLRRIGCAIISVVLWLPCAVESAGPLTSSTGSTTGSSTANSAVSLTTLTSEERLWLSRGPHIRYAVDPRWQPLEFVEEGQARGLSVAYLKKIADVTGLHFDALPAASWQEAVEHFVAGRVDLLPGAFTDIAALRAVVPRYSSPYFAGASMIVAAGNVAIHYDPASLSGKRVAVEEHGKYQGWFRRYYPDLLLVPVPDEPAALAALAERKADVAVVTDAVALPLLHQQYAGVLHALGSIPDIPPVMRMAIRQDQPMLASVIDKALASIDATDAAGIDEEWLSRADFTRPSVKGVLRYFGTEVWFALLAMLSLAFGLHQAWRKRDAVARTAREKTLFLATMSHEIRGPVHALLAPLELLDRTGRDNSDLFLLDTAIDAGHLLQKLLDDLLEYARIGDPGFKLALCPCDVVQLVAASVDMQQQAAHNKGLSIHLKAPSAVLPPVRIDPVRLRQIVMNLLSNAIKFTVSGGIVVTVTHKEPSRHANGAVSSTWVIDIDDTGMGIPKDVLADLFKPFSRGRAGTNERFAGSGLGLMISRQLAEMMGGSLTLHSDVGVGTVARLTIVGEIDSSASSPDDGSEQRKGYVDVDAGGDRADAVVPSGSVLFPPVLVIEDHPGVQATITRQLQRLGLESEVVADRLAAERALRSRRYLAALIDGHLPDGDTFATVSAYRIDEERAGGARLPIFGISASVDARYPERCLQSGFDGVLLKPIRLHQLAELFALWFPALPLQPEDIGADDGTDVFPGAAETFVAETARDIDAIRAALQLDDIARLSKHAHRICGSATFVRAEALEAAARQLEAAVGSTASTDRQAIVCAIACVEAAFSSWKASR